MNKEHNTQTVNIFTAGHWNRMKTWLEESVEGGLMFHTSSRFFLCTSLDISLYRDYPFAGNTLIIVATTSCTPVRPAYRDREGERKRGKRASLNPEIYGPVSSSRVSLKVLYLLDQLGAVGHPEWEGTKKFRIHNVTVEFSGEILDGPWAGANKICHHLSVREAASNRFLHIPLPSSRTQA